MDLIEYVLFIIINGFYPESIFCHDSYRSVTIPQRDNPQFPYLAKRCESCRPLGMFRPSEDEFLLCYDG